MCILLYFNIHCNINQHLSAFILCFYQFSNQLATLYLDMQSYSSYVSNTPTMCHSSETDSGPLSTVATNMPYLNDQSTSYTGSVQYPTPTKNLSPHHEQDHSTVYDPAIFHHHHSSVPYESYSSESSAQQSMDKFKSANVQLLDIDIWKRFCEVNNEMIVTKSGRYGFTMKIYNYKVIL